ncbi:Sapep family Mn(2+)-dependent dipeptidase [Collinsella ihumii]|uniref:Sapep family Mn(2+)-dependent dipeptidase n=1 Tax=Collinsella ihumii TaxID=1720204 RepID=UPI0025AABEC0|nr:Sapep family Mn(2+)-dependent dipeptidase [Collinsella ihumii]MDN0056243.1 Sapep family Mn(2+)-dependent dipeptidase [Collinsella ihumii]
MDQELENSVDAYVDEVWEDVIADIADLVSHPSVADENAGTPGAPFGAPARAALDCALGIARKLGYETSDDEGYIGIADIPGASDTQIATIAHVDVVPAGPGWSTDPFVMERREGWLLGRGVIDDKGPAVLSLYAGAYLKHAGITPRYTFRALLGSDEEVGMTDVHHYLAGHDHPAFLFTPDAEFPVCNAEKGQFGATFTSGPIEGGRILSWSGAEATNAIPSESVCELAVDASACPAPVANADRIDVEAIAPGRTRISAHGIGGHASLPEGTINAIGLIVGYLREANLVAESEKPYLELLSIIHADTAGEALGIATSSEAFGPLTVNGGTIEVADGRISQTIDVRFPDSTTAEQLEATCSEVAGRFGAALAVGHANVPFSVSADHPAVQTLLDVYQEVTGKPAELLSMGGGTYARNFKRAVSFGPEDNSLELPAWGGSMHGPNECASEAQLKGALKMYILSILRLMDVEF